MTNLSSIAGAARQNLKAAIIGARTQSQLEYAVAAYLTHIDETAAPGEAYLAIAARRGGDELLEAAEQRRIELESKVEVPWAATNAAPH
jgi:hypothetical protein